MSEIPASKGPQRLSILSLVDCQRCGNRVHFRSYSSRPTADPRYKVAYLRCPACGATATQMQEVESLPPPTGKTKRVKYRYSGVL